ncbi:hypothetical protein K402DRAFT_395716 [Aulographum hederae CBS 113979]|uniref:Poly(A) RNA polymerase mitochondrial-like central palm domain-containing protein n=1 Tax=Aulographum hederae CBS 113979 TaxID=1176131 RepID=A0A6G1GUC7_9PEZI|nr:hypothetical protein K402DRAFT_395716 [Aulographum hederae CBS 113979]
MPVSRRTVCSASNAFITNRSLCQLFSSHPRNCASRSAFSTTAKASDPDQVSVYKPRTRPIIPSAPNSAAPETLPSLDHSQSNKLPPNKLTTKKPLPQSATTKPRSKGLATAVQKDSKQKPRQSLVRKVTLAAVAQAGGVPGAHRLSYKDGVPWISSPQQTDFTLEFEIREFAQWLAPTRDESAGFEAVTRDVQRVCRSILPDHGFRPFGSASNGLVTSISDLDFRLCPPSDEADPSTAPEMAPHHLQRLHSMHALNQLFRQLDYHPNFMLARLRHARYPLITIMHKKSGVEVQIVCSNDTSLQHIYIERYLTEYPALLPVYTLLKATLDIRGLLDVFRGGLSSYSLFMMLVASSKHNPDLDGADCASLLVQFLRFYSAEDFTRYGYQVDPPARFEKAPLVPAKRRASKPVGNLFGTQDPSHPDKLCLRDPADANNDLGRKARGWHYIRATLEALRSKLEYQQGTFRTKRSLPLLTPFIDNCPSVYSGRRAMLAEFGASEHSV